MIELIQTGKCENCPEISPKVGLLYGDGGRIVETVVACEHQKVCDRIEDHLIELLKQEYPGG